jgi:hypothetical protein
MTPERDPNLCSTCGAYNCASAYGGDCPRALKLWSQLWQDEFRVETTEIGFVVVMFGDRIVCDAMPDGQTLFLVDFHDPDDYQSLSTRQAALKAYQLAGYSIESVLAPLEY